MSTMNTIAENKPVAAGTEEGTSNPTIEEGIIPTAKNGGGPNQRLSVTSAKYDLNNKGYLDPEEKKLRAYDTNNDGKLDLIELKKIVRDLSGTEKKEHRWRRYSQFAGIFLLLSVLCNFAMVWVALILTRQVETQNGKLYDGHGNLVVVKAQGQHFVPIYNEEHGRQLSELEGRRLARQLSEEDHQEKIRQLQDTVPVATMARADAQTFFNNVQANVAQSVSIKVGDTIHSGVVGSGVTYTPSNSEGCQEANNIIQQGQTSPVYRLVCCGTSNEECQVYMIVEGRRLCFAPLTIVDVEGKGPTYIKDVQPGDKVLAQGGKYQTLYTFSHFSKVQPSRFVQLITSDRTLELSSEHMVYLYGKRDPVQAGSVQVDDVLVGVGRASKEPVKVIGIGHVVRDGFYHGLTADGTIVANGLLASTHVSHFGAQEYLIEAWGLKLIHAATFEHYFVERPMREFCLRVSVDSCNRYTFNDKKDVAMKRNLYDYIGNVWHEQICAAHHVPDFLMLLGSITFLLLFNVLVTPRLVLGLLLLAWGRKPGSTSRVNCCKKSKVA